MALKDHLINKIILMVGIIAVLGVASSSVVIASPAYAQAQPTHVIIEKFNQSDVPPGLTRVTIIHGIDGTRTEIDHGPGVVPPPKKQESFQCTSGANTDQCDTNSFNGKKWFSLPLSYSVNLEDASDDGNFLAAVNVGIQTWEDDLNSSFDAEFLGETGKISSTAQPRAKMDGSNVIDWGSTKHFGGTVIAVVVFFYFTSTGEMVEADMRFNKDLSWSSNGGPGAISDPDNTTGLSGFFDVQNIATHEGGHYVSGLKDLKDSTERELTMYGFGSTGELKKRTLGLGDQLSIATAYPGTTTSPTTNDPPVVDISSPTDGSTSDSGTTINFAGTASDTEDGDLTASLVWISDLDGQIGTGGSFSTTELSVGTHTITASVTDTGGKTGSAQISITVKSTSPPPGGSTMSISSIDYATEGGKNKDKHLIITIQVVDDLSNKVSGASVSIDLWFDNDGDKTKSDGDTFVGSGSGTTGDNGSVTFTLKNAPASCYTTEVTSISAGSLTWDGSTLPNGVCK